MKKTGCFSPFDISATITKLLDQSINLFWKRNCIAVIGRDLLLTHQLQKFLNRECTNINGLDFDNKSKANERSHDSNFQYAKIGHLYQITQFCCF